MKPGAVRLNVADIDPARRFYEETIGLRPVAGEGEHLRLGADGSTLVELVDAPGAPRRPPRTTGLFHLAILLESRLELARALSRIVRSGWPLTGASDHLVSEALYLSDPEGNGIEVYRDRPREDWPFADGQLEMATVPLDVDSVADELAGAGPGSSGVAAGTRIGHVHLNVADLDRAEAFYCDLLGFEVTMRGYPGALFVSTGGYHHHLGLNTWAARAAEGVSRPPAGALGLARFELLVDEAFDLDRLERRLSAAGVETHRGDDGVQVADPFGNGLLLRTR
jgi:catechol 2,3-dioxygenase